ncbi:MAG TPA: glycosyltransferase family 9 protein [Hanamia sp.]|nr:glycosyltransferase family 9 protein [Hanamia sp.]
MDIPAKKWTKEKSPKRILAIRLQAMGDLVITLPYLQSLRNALPPDTKLDLLTLEENKSIPQSIELFDKIYSIRGFRNFKKQLAFTCLLLPKILLHRYDVVLDLQNNLISKIVRKAVMPYAWSEFDRFSPIAAGESTRLTIEAIGLGQNFQASHFKLKKEFNVKTLLKENGWDGTSSIVILNPAGAFATRNWPLKNYVDFAKLWLDVFPATQFLILGIGSIAAKADFFKSELGNKLINLVNKTSPAQAFAIIQTAKFVLSEDSGLMHMAWVSGIPTLAMFGSTCSDRSRPLGNHTVLLDSSDLECGNCMLEFCKYGETHCLTRYTPEIVFEKAVTLLHSVAS